jgi:hypothetical protein
VRDVHHVAFAPQLGGDTFGQRGRSACHKYQRNAALMHGFSSGGLLFLASPGRAPGSRRHDSQAATCHAQYYRSSIGIAARGKPAHVL